MINEIEGYTASHLYEEALQHMRVSGVKESSRNGQVLTLLEPAVMTLHNPMCRIIDDAVRKANPFFHLMEFIWMVAGRNDSKWISQFNKNMESFADDGVIYAAYGYRWTKLFKVDQIHQVIQKLKSNKGTRQAVIQMWDVQNDLLGAYKDKACNIAIMFRVVQGALNMTVINRSNDLIWGALGANIVHMTMLHETIAHFADIPLGKYRVFSNNLHMYTEREDFEPNIRLVKVQDMYRDCKIDPIPIFTQKDESYANFQLDCEWFCKSHSPVDCCYLTPFMRETVLQVHRAWISRGEVEYALDICNDIANIDWRYACRNWLLRKYAIL